MKSYPDVDAYLADARSWQAEMQTLRVIVLAAGLDEAVKWGKPCYSAHGGNVAIMQPFKGFLALLFVKGVLLKDPEEVLKSQGENTRGARRMEFGSLDDVALQAFALRGLLAEAVAVEKAGQKVDYQNDRALEFPDELVDALDADPQLREAWEALTPGRQRGWVLHFTGAKKPETRVNRVEKAAARILVGKGWNER